jgi:DNA-binding winged helix-turn-helix (wHTH) protein/Tol biopolymer transport system component
METTKNTTFSFDEFEVDALKRILLKKGQPVSLNPKTFDLLLTLVEHRGAVLSKNELLDKVWENQFVEENNLTVHVAALRKILGEKKNENRFIVTVPGRGYKFIAELNEPIGGEIVIESHSLSKITIEESEETEESYQPKTISPASKKPASKTLVWLATGVLVLSLLGILAWRSFSPKLQPATSKQTKISRLTASGKISAATVSPDGKYVVFAQKEAGGQSVWLRQIETGSQTRVVEPKAVDYLGLTVSPDGNFIYCTVFVENLADPAVWRVPFLGGAARQLLFYTGIAVSFSPDGRKIAFNQARSRSLGETHLNVADADGANFQVLVRLRDAERSFVNYDSNAVAWSTDGELIAAIIEENGKSGATVTAFDAATGEEKFLTETRWSDVSHLAWTADGEHLAVAARDADDFGSQIWLVSRKSGAARKITSDASGYGFLATAKDSPALLAVQKNVVSTLYVADFDLQNSALAPRPVLAETSRLDNVNWTTEGKILYSSRATGKSEIWRVEADGANPVQLTADAHIAFGMSVSADGQKIVFNSRREDGKLSLWMADADGKNPRQITDGAEDVHPKFAADNRIVFQRGLNNKTLTLWRTAPGEAPFQLTETNTPHPHVSPDGKRVAYYFMDVENPNEKLWRIGLIDVETGAFLQKIAFPKFVTARQMRWHPDGEFLAQVFYEGDEANLLLLPTEPGSAAEKTIKNLGKGEVGSFAFSRDGRRIAFALDTETRDVVTITDF